MDLAFIGQLLFVVFFFAFSIFIHELGHLLAALWCGLHVDKFSIGFGPRIFGVKIKGIDFIVGPLPLGGYVALPQLDHASDAPTTEDGKPLPLVSPRAKIITALAGPLFNLLFALVLGMILWKAGRTGSSDGMVVKSVPEWAIEKKLGLQAGDVITAINGSRVKTDNDFFSKYALAKEVVLSVRRDGHKLEFGPYQPPRDQDAEGLRLPQFHAWMNTPAVIGAVGPLGEDDTPSPAQKAGLQAGDRIVSINGTQIKYFDEIRAALQAHNVIVIERGSQMLTLNVEAVSQYSDKLGIVFVEYPRIYALLRQSPAQGSDLKKGDLVTACNGHPMPIFSALETETKVFNGDQLEITVEREGKELTVSLPRRVESYRLGIGPQMPLLYMTPQEQIGGVLRETFNTLKAIVRPDSGINLSHMSGVVGISVGIFKVLGHQGWREALAFILMINVSLMIFNLLPLPVLDGGHIVVACLETILRRRLPSGAVRMVYNVFVLLLIGMMLFALYNDTRRLTQKVQVAQVEKSGSINISADLDA